MLIACKAYTWLTGRIGVIIPFSDAREFIDIRLKLISIWTNFNWNCYAKMRLYRLALGPGVSSQLKTHACCMYDMYSMQRANFRKDWSVTIVWLKNGLTWVWIRCQANAYLNNYQLFCILYIMLPRHHTTVTN